MTINIFLKRFFIPSFYLSRKIITNWSAKSSTVFIENLLEQKLKRSSNDGPSNSITITL